MHTTTMMQLLQRLDRPSAASMVLVTLAVLASGCEGAASGWKTLDGGVDGIVNAVEQALGGFVFVGGNFQKPVPNLAMWNSSAWVFDAQAPNASVTSLSSAFEGLYVGGEFTSPGNHIALFDGVEWHPLGSGLSDKPLCFKQWSSGLFVGGVFVTAGGMVAHSIARWDGSGWSALGAQIPQGQAVWDMTEYQGKLVISGEFLTVGAGTGTATQFIALFDGEHWSGLGGGSPNDEVGAVLGVGDQLFAGGHFTQVGSVAASLMARWDGSSWHAMGNGCSGQGLPYAEINGIVQFGSSIIAGGSLNMAGTTACGNLAAWDGTTWGCFNGGTSGRLISVVTFGQDQLYIGGDFATVGGNTTAGGVAEYVLGRAQREGESSR
jgi:trimeric autotransporter adhesin